MEILGIGNAIVDVICKIDDNFLKENSLTKSTMKLVDENQFKKLLSNLKIEETISGGSVANSIVGLAQLGNDVGFIGKISDDDLGKEYEKGLKQENVNYFYSKKKDTKLFDNIIKLPTTLKEINETIENTLAKVKFNQNSSIKLKEYLLNKNEKKLTKNDDFVILTEKEIQLLELLLNNNDPVSKNKILSTVWNYSTDADTHTVETHIYRLRKKINDKFFDSKFILNNKQGYYF